MRIRLGCIHVHSHSMTPQCSLCAQTTASYQPIPVSDVPTHEYGEFFSRGLEGQRDFDQILKLKNFEIGKKLRQN